MFNSECGIRNAELRKRSSRRRALRFGGSASAPTAGVLACQWNQALLTTSAAAENLSGSRTSVRNRKPHALVREVRKVLKITSQTLLGCLWEDSGSSWEDSGKSKFFPALPSASQIILQFFLLLRLPARPLAIRFRFLYNKNQQ